LSLAAHKHSLVEPIILSLLTCAQIRHFRLLDLECFEKVNVPLATAKILLQHLGRALILHFRHLKNFLLGLVARLGWLFLGRVGPLGAVLVLRVELVLLEVGGLRLLQVVAVVALVLWVLLLLQVGVGLLVLVRYNLFK